MKIYLVGGAVRDKLLGYPHHERDWVVVGARPEELEAQGFIPVGKDFPVFLHPKTKEEYALARTERKTGPGYTGFSFHSSPEVTLEEDLRRRDLTINAMAEDDSGQLVDPYGGREDLQRKLLRHVSPAFAEDPVRVLRVARLAARYHHLGFRIAPETVELMKQLVDNGEVDHLVAERIWKETERALMEKSPEVFITSLRDCGALARIMPELDALFGVPQPAEHHPEIDTGEHCLMVLQQAVRMNGSARVRFAALTHDLGKGATPPAEWPKHIGHEQRSLSLVNELCERLAAPKEFRELARLAAQYHTHGHRAMELKPSTVLKLFKAADAFRRPTRFEEFLLCCEADARGRTGFEDRPYPQANYLRSALARCRAIDNGEIAAQGFTGKAFGQALDKERLRQLSKVKSALTD
ncbi:multifunctional CCA addition/repair protein [Marinimicrobium sp. ABcell2]|uniref:multifunctional CCA addition/repair protein n=1 Tax=Marinimicrobium sp. ABcell2 TaxID=3069751 RepID=UPI0027B2CFE2|nr:multifunctional CCA addition/repair protein [Marinimicrobium sp. ABcell2]MDQ2077584.1 multifunctional CCA addition/repair protein [Marinimicrobium sp. ABcell2]